MPKSKATESISEAVTASQDICAYCGANIATGQGVAAKDGAQEVRCCSWRHLHWYLVDTFTTGKHIERGMAQ